MSIKVNASGPFRATIDWTEIVSYGQKDEQLEEDTEGSTLASTPVQDENNDRDDEEGSTDAYEAFLDLAYTRPESSDDEDKEGEENEEPAPESDEEIEASEAFSILPARTCLLQQQVPRRGWLTLYNGSGNNFEMKNFPLDQECRLRVKILPNTHDDSQWNYFSYNSPGLVVGGRELWEAVTRGNASDLANVLHQIHKNSQINCLNACAEEGITHLVTCAQRGAREAFAMLLEAGAGVSVRTGGPQVTPIHGAAWGGYRNLIKRIETAGASWESKDRANRHPIEYAIMNSKLEIVKNVLRSAGNLQAFHFERPILSVVIQAASYNASRKSKLSEDSENSIESLEDGTKNTFDAIIDILIEHGADVNEKGPDGLTPLHTAVILGENELAKKLIKIGADANLLNDYGFSAQQLMKSEE